MRRVVRVLPWVIAMAVVLPGLAADPEVLPAGKYVLMMPPSGPSPVSTPPLTSHIPTISNATIVSPRVERVRLHRRLFWQRC